MRERIFYVLYDDLRPFGGEKHSYQHVDVLNDAGFEAYALHRQTGYRHRWFANQTRVIDLASFWDIYDKERDYLVVPEAMGAFALSLPGRKVIFNKNLYVGYERLGLGAAPRYPFNHDKVEAVFSVSEHNLQHLAFAFPSIPLYRMYAHIDVDRFAFRPLPEKKRRIACVVKDKEDLATLIHTVRARCSAGLNHLADYEWTLLQNLSEDEVAQVLGDSLMLVALSTREGLPRSVLEGMAAGCLLIAHGTGPLKECLPPEYSFERDDFIAMARRIEEIASAFPGDIDRWAAVARRGRTIAEGYTRDRQREHLLAAWRDILSRAPRQ